MVKCLASLNTGLFYCQIAITGQSLRVEDLTIWLLTRVILIAFLMHSFILLNMKLALHSIYN